MQCRGGGGGARSSSARPKAPSVLAKGVYAFTLSAALLLL